MAQQNHDIRRKEISLERRGELLCLPEVEATVWRDFRAEMSSAVSLNCQLRNYRQNGLGFYVQGKWQGDCF